MVWRTILEYIWDISDGATQFKQAVHDYAVAGLGYFYAYTDPEADYGRGEIKFTYVDPFRVYVDPASRDRYYDDATGVLLSTVITKEQLLDLYPALEEYIKEIETMNMEEDYPDSSMKNTAGSFTPDIVKDYDFGDGSEKYRILEHFEKVKVPFYRIFDSQSGAEKVMDMEEMQQLMTQNPEAFEQGLVQAVEVLQTRIKVTCSVGSYILYERILNSDSYPIIPVPNIWTNTPYPKSDVSKVKDSQRLLNKLFSLTLSHAQSSAGLKLLVPEGSVDDLKQLEVDWANPNAVIQYNPEFGEPHFPQPSPLASEFYHLIDRVEHYIDLNFGIPELMQGFKEGAPDTVRGTAMLSEMGESRGKSKLRDIEGSLDRLGKVIYGLAKGHYNFQKTFRIVQPNNDITEFTVNNRLYDDKQQELMSIENDISIGQHDVRILSGSTLPSNKMAEYNMYLEAYKLNLVDDVEVLKKTEIFDKEGVLKRKGMIMQLQQQLQGATEQIKKLEGDLQTADREVRHSRQKAELEKFKGDIGDIAQKAKYQEKASINKLETAVTKAIAKEELKIQKQTMEDKANRMGAEGS